MTKKTVEERFWSKVEKTETCWNWIGTIERSGYGRFWLKKNVSAHGFSYLLSGGELINGLHLDHLCRNKRCVNPGHLEQVTPRENTLRGVGPSAINAKKSKCHRGHTYQEASIYISPNKPNSRNCRLCIAISSKERHKKLYKKTTTNFCPHGHEFTESNTIKGNSRHCRICKRASDARYRLKKLQIKGLFSPNQKI